LLARLEAVLARNPKAFTETIFTPSELAHWGDAADRLPRLALAFASKEAVMKALGQGLGQGLSPTEIDCADGPDHVRLYGLAAQHLGSRTLHLRVRLLPPFATAECRVLPPGTSLLCWQSQLRQSMRLLPSGTGRRFAADWAFSADERRIYGERKQAASALAARLLVKWQVLRLLRKRGIGQGLRARQVSVLAEPSGKPTLALPMAVERCLLARRLRLEVSLSHAGTVVMAAVLLLVRQVQVGVQTDLSG
jgi:holo-[acyl-carrier protein] synthase